MNTRETKTFQFPSNGKAYLKCADIYVKSGLDKLFQFPSNGKAYLKSKRPTPTEIH